MLRGITTKLGQKLGRAAGTAAAHDVAQLINPQETDQSLIGRMLNVAKELNTLAQNKPLPVAGPLEDNREEKLIDAQMRLDFAFGERLSHDLAYRDITQQQSIIPLLEEDNIVRHYQMIKLDSDHKGIDGNILIPHSHPELLRVYVNFRGSDPSVLATLHLDLERNAGEESFHRHYAKMMKQINGFIGQVAASEQKPVELIISGYSLGGALSQHCFNLATLFSALHLRADLKKVKIDTSTQELITAAQETLNQHLLKEYNIEPLKFSLTDYQHFAKVRTFKINTWGSTGVSHSIEGCSNLIANILVDNGKNIVGRFGANILDLIPRTGDAKILSSCYGDTAYMKVEDINLDVGRSILSGCISGVTTGLFMGGPVGAIVGSVTFLTQGLRPISLAHTSFNFGNTGEKLASKKYQVILNTSCKNGASIREIAHDPLTVLQYPLLIQAKDALRKAGDVGAKLKNETCKTIVKGLAHAHNVVEKAQTKVKPALSLRA